MITRLADLEWRHVRLIFVRDGANVVPDYQIL